MVTKSEKLKEALGLAGPTTAAVVPPGCKSVYQIVSDSPDFTYLKNAIDATGLKSLLDNPALIATVFAPDDSGFTKTLVDLVIDAQELFSDPVSLTVLLKYHVVPGLSLTKADLMDTQAYDTLLVDKKDTTYQITYDTYKEIKLKEAAANNNLTQFTTPKYYMIPSGGKKAKIAKFDLENPGCPSVVHDIDRVLIPAYTDALLVDAADTALSYSAATLAAGAPFPGNETKLAGAIAKSSSAGYSP